MERNAGQLKCDFVHKFYLWTDLLAVAISFFTSLNAIIVTAHREGLTG